jgi:phosphoribosylaminoimidazole-succinocarboxamide synthase
MVNQDVPTEWQGRAVRCRRLEMLPVECIARGYLAGLGLEAYRTTGTISGVVLPTGLAEADRLPAPVFTPSTKAAQGEHDEYVTSAEVGNLVGPETAGELERLTLAIYARGAEVARERGVIIADTKLEFGRDAAGVLTLGDEVLTPDSSRFWKAAEWQPGRRQTGYDKQVVRDWSASLTDWDRTTPGPEVPPEVVTEARARYVEIYERLTGQRWSS